MGERGAMGGCFSCVENGSVGLVTQCGAFKRIATPGVNCICCCTGEMVQATLNLRQQQLNVELETKTKDDVSVKVVVSVQYLISNDKDFSEEGSYYKAYYKDQARGGRVAALHREYHPRLQGAGQAAARAAHPEGLPGHGLRCAGPAAAADDGGPRVGAGGVQREGGPARLLRGLQCRTCQGPASLSRPGLRAVRGAGILVDVYLDELNGCRARHG